MGTEFASGLINGLAMLALKMSFLDFLAFQQIRSDPWGCLSRGKTAQATGIYSVRRWSDFMVCCVHLHRLELVLLIILDGLPHPQVSSWCIQSFCGVSLPLVWTSLVLGCYCIMSLLIKLNFFAWLECKGRIKTSEFLQRIGVLNLDANTACVFCNSEAETLNHILLFCPFVWKVGSEMISWCWFHWVILASVEGIPPWRLGFKFSMLQL